MAKFTKGNKGNPRGRGKGTLNVTTREARLILNNILSGEFEYIQKSLKNVRLKDDARYLELLAKLLTFYLPRRTDLTSDDEPINAGFLGMTKEEIENELAQWKKHI